MKIVLYDVESKPNTCYTWGLHNQFIAINQIKESHGIISWAAKDLGSRSVLYADDTIGHEKMIRQLHKVLSEADAVCTYNGQSFDNKMLNAELVRLGLKPLPPTKQIDLYKTVKKHFRFPSNKLDYVAQALGIGEKVKHEGFGLWVRCMENDPKAWAKLKKYNCLTPDHRVLHTDMRWKTLADTKVGDVILGFDEDGPGRKYKSSVVESMEYRPEDVYKVTLSNGKEFKATADHKWLIAKLRHRADEAALRHYEWVETKDLLAGKHVVPHLSDVWDEVDTKDDGWLAGFLDGEGNLYNGPLGNGGPAITFTQKEGEELEKAKAILRDMEFKHSQSELQFGTGTKIIRKVGILGHAWARLKLLGEVRPERLIRGVCFDRIGRLEARGGYEHIVSVEYVGVQDVAVMSTSTGTFVCDGYPMHNCGDVKLLEKLYYKLQGWITNHPSHSLEREDHVCPNCASKRLQQRGYATTKIAKYKRFQCLDCGSWSRGRVSEVEEKDKVVVGF